MKKMFKIAAVISIAGLSLAGCSSSSDNAADGGDATEGAEEYVACLVSDAGGWDDKSFNESAKNGLDDAVADFNVVPKTAESKDANDFEANVQNMVDEGCNLIIGVGFSLAEAIGNAAKENPDISFGLVDSEFSEETAGDNTKALVFNTHESAYLAGYAAAAMSKSGKVGTFGGMKIPSVTIFMDGFADGVAKFNEDEGKNVEVIGWDKATQEGQFADSFDDQQLGTQIAESMIQQGADVIMPVAGPVGFGAAAAAREHGEVMIVGVDTDWYESSEYGDVTLTSVQKAIDKAVYDTIKAGADGTFDNSNYVGTIANEGLNIAPFHDFEANLPEGLADKLNELKAQIADGTIVVESPSAFEVK